jgi:hypothetical protein
VCHALGRSYDVPLVWDSRNLSPQAERKDQLPAFEMREGGRISGLATDELRRVSQKGSHRRGES